MGIALKDLQSKILSGSPSGIETIEIKGPRPVKGTICKIDLREYEFRVFYFQDLVCKSLHPDSPEGCSTQFSINLGCTVRDFISGDRYECEGHEAYENWIPPYRDFYRNCLIASNTLQTNFIRSNGFVIYDGNVICKPLHAWGRDDEKYGSEGVAGDYTALIVEGSQAEIKSISVTDAGGKATNPSLSAGSFGIASPKLIEGGKIVPIAQEDSPFRKANGRLNGDCVDWDPRDVASSFTAFGIAKNELGETTILVMASIFAGEWGVDIDMNSGIHSETMAELLIRECDVQDAILGGGAADTQQFVHWRYPRFRHGPVRFKAPNMTRGEVEGIRGMGAIAGILPRP